MTPKEAIERIKYIICNDGYYCELAKDHYPCEEPCKEYVALTMAISALEKADKYRWHDLRKDPNDLPTKDGYYWVHGVLTNGKHIEAERKYINMTYFDAPWNFNVIAWKEMERFEEVD